MVKTKCYSFLLVIIIIACGYTFYLAYDEVKNETIKQLNAEQMVYAKLAARGIEKHFRDIYEELKLFSELTDVIIFNDHGATLIEHYYEINKSDVDAITRMDKNGTIIYTHPHHNSHGANISTKTIYKNL